MNKNTKKKEETHEKKENINFESQKKKTNENSFSSKLKEEKWRYVFLFFGLYLFFEMLISNYNETYFFSYSVNIT